jgi:hypothetical protein
MLAGVEATSSTSRAQKSARAHRSVRLLVVVVALALLGRTSYHVTLATEQFFRLFSGAVR